MTTNTGKVVGFWFSDPADAGNTEFVEAMIAKHSLWHWLGAGHRLVANTVDDRGGLFVMFADHPGPGESTAPAVPATTPLTGPTLQVNGVTYPLHTDFGGFSRDAAAGKLALWKTTLGGLSVDDFSKLFGVLAEKFGEDSPQTWAMRKSGFHCLNCFQPYSLNVVYFRWARKQPNTVSLSPQPDVTKCLKCGGEEAVWIYDPALGK